MDSFGQLFLFLFQTYSIHLSNNRVPSIFKHSLIFHTLELPVYFCVFSFLWREFFRAGGCETVIFQFSVILFHLSLGTGTSVDLFFVLFLDPQSGTVSENNKTNFPLELRKQRGIKCVIHGMSGFYITSAAPPYWPQDARLYYEHCMWRSQAKAIKYSILMLWLLVGPPWLDWTVLVRLGWVRLGWIGLGWVGFAIG